MIKDRKKVCKFTYQIIISFCKILGIAFFAIRLYNSIRNFFIRKVTDMKTETVELIRLIAEAKDKEKAVLTAFAIMLDRLTPRESGGSASAATRRFADQKNLPS
jgi:hypothetical protein